MSVVPFGKAFREQYFPFAENVLNLNHGSFGKTPTPVMKAREKYLEEIQSYPDDFFKNNIHKETKLAREIVCKDVNLHTDEEKESLVLVQNATTAANAILGSYPFQKDDIILYFSIDYVSCIHTLQVLSEKVGVKLEEVPINYPVKDSEILNKFTEKLNALPKKPSLVFMDGIVSNPGVLFPWQLITTYCKPLNILTFVDGAHWYGLLPLDLSPKNPATPDFFCANLHKWFYVPTSIALLYVDKKHFKKIVSCPVSAVIDHNVKFYEKFTYVGTYDYSPLLCIKDAKLFRDEICGGEENIRNYITNLVKISSDYIVKNWKGTELIIDYKTSMFNTKIPNLTTKTHDLVKISNFLNSQLLVKEKCFIPFFIHNNAIWGRWSCQLYLDLDDFKKGLEIIKKTVDLAIESSINKGKL